MNAYYSFYFKILIFLHFLYFVNSKILTFSYTYLKISYSFFSVYSNLLLLYALLCTLLNS